MALSGLDRRFSAAVSDGGLFIDIARECRPHYPPDTDLLFLCGRDAAERIVGWDYGDPGAFGRMLGEFRLLVARRGAQYLPPSKYAGRIEALPIAGSWDEVSATEVRDRVSRGDNWRHLVPEALAPLIEEIYSN
jgi:nicotinic acid mononucleotide adenylyltransferase